MHKNEVHVNKIHANYLLFEQLQIFFHFLIFAFYFPHFLSFSSKREIKQFITGDNNTACILFCGVIFKKNPS